MKGWRPDADLDRLLDALAQDLLAASDEELCRVHRDAGCPVEGAAHEVRAMIEAAAEDERGPELPLAVLARVADYAKQH